MNAWDEMRKAMREATDRINAADNMADDMAAMLIGRLRKISAYRLKRLKRELRDFNIHTGEWKS